MQNVRAGRSYQPKKWTDGTRHALALSMDLDAGDQRAARRRQIVEEIIRRANAKGKV